MITETRLLSVCARIAVSSLGVGANRNYKVGAVLFNKRRILSGKPNSYKTHTALHKISKYPHLHAETHTIISYGLDNCSGLALLVTRVRQPNNQLTMAKPCSVCQELIHNVNIKECYYTDWNGNIQCL